MFTPIGLGGLLDAEWRRRKDEEDAKALAGFGGFDPGTPSPPQPIAGLIPQQDPSQPGPDAPTPFHRDMANVANGMARYNGGQYQLGPDMFQAANPGEPPRFDQPLPRRSMFGAEPEQEQARRAHAIENYYTKQKMAAQDEQQSIGESMMSAADEENQRQFQDEVAANDAAMGRIQAEAARLHAQIKQDAGTKVDENQVFKKMGVWGSIAMLVSIGLSGYLNPRGTNQAWAALQKMIDRNIDVQKTNIENKRKQTYADLQALQTEEGFQKYLQSTAEWKRATAYELVAKHARLIGSQTTDKFVKARAAEMDAKAESAAADQSLQNVVKANALKERYLASANTARAGVTKVQIQTQASTENNQRTNEEKRHATDLGFAHKEARLLHDVTSAQLDRENRLEIAKLKAKYGGSGHIPASAFPVSVTDPVSGKLVGSVRNSVYPKVAQAMLFHAKVEDEMDEILALAGQSGWWDRRPDLANLGSERSHRISALYAKLITDIAHGEGYGANFTETEQEFIKRQTGYQPDTWTTQDLYDRLKAIRDLRHKHYQWMLNTYLIQGGDGRAAAGYTPRSDWQDAYSYSNDQATPTSQGAAKPPVDQQSQDLLDKWGGSEINLGFK